MEGILDKEFAAIVETLAALDPLDPRARVRVLAYVIDRFAIASTRIQVDSVEQKAFIIDTQKFRDDNF